MFCIFCIVCNIFILLAKFAILCNQTSPLRCEGFAPQFFSAILNVALFGKREEGFKNMRGLRLGEGLRSWVMGGQVLKISATKAGERLVCFGTGGRVSKTCAG